jgi:hypothetical protein
MLQAGDFTGAIAAHSKAMLIATELGDRALDARCAAFLGDALRRRGAALRLAETAADASEDSTVGDQGFALSLTASGQFKLLGASRDFVFVYSGILTSRWMG